MKKRNSKLQNQNKKLNLKKLTILKLTEIQKISGGENVGRTQTDTVITERPTQTITKEIE